MSERKTETDSAIIEGYILTLNAEMIVENSFDEESDSVRFSLFVDSLKRNPELLDSLMDAEMMNGGGWSGGEVYYAPDSAFKIFIIDGEEVGATSHAMYKSFMHFKSGKATSRYSYEPISDLFMVDTNVYVIIEHGASHPGNDYGILSQFKIVSDTIQYVLHRYTLNF